MPGDENHPNTQPAGNPAGAAGGVQQTRGGVLDPTLVAIGNLQTAMELPPEQFTWTLSKC